MTTPSKLVENFGVEVELEKVTDAEFDEDTGSFIEDESTIETVQVKTVISQPESVDEKIEAGRLDTGSKQFTFSSNVDVKADREGRRDRIKHDGRVYEVVEVSFDVNPFSNDEKLTVIGDRLNGSE